MSTPHCAAVGGQACAPVPSSILAEAREWALTLSAGRVTAGDVNAFKQWRVQSALHERAWTQVCADWQALGGAARSFDLRRPAFASGVRRQRQMQRRMFLGTAATAFGALAVVGMVHPPRGLWPSLSELGADYRTAVGEQRDVRLAADVLLALNTRTSVSVHAGKQALQLELIAGEAALSTAGAVCELLAGDARVRVAGGEVEVRRLEGDRVRVVCQAGSAEVLHGSEALLLTAQQQVLVAAGTPASPVSEVSGQAAWRHGKVVFENLSLADAVDEINRYRPGRVVLLDGSLARRRFSASFDIATLDDAIALLQQVYELRVRRVGDVVFLT